MNPATTPPIALQLYSSRDFGGSLDSLFGEVAAAGYSGVETVGTQGCTAKELRDLLGKHGLKVCSSHYALEALQEGLKEIAGFHGAVGNRDLVVPWLPHQLYDDTKESWQTIGRQLGELGARCREHGLRLHYHNHAFEMAEVEGRLGLEWLLDAASPENLGFEPDLAWMVRGGVAPMTLLEGYAGRCELVHIKDLTAEGENADEGGWADVGAGRLPWDELLPAARVAGARWLIVEHDQPKDPVASLRRSARFLQDRLL
jgi:sugar phosphate isomerase/epimerase